MEFRRGDIYYVRPAGAVTGNEIMSGRPGIIVSNDINNRFSGTIEIVYLTTKPKKDAPTHVSIKSAPQPSTALCEQVSTVSIERIGAFAGKLTKEEMAAVNVAVLCSLGFLRFKGASEASDKTPEKKDVPSESEEIRYYKDTIDVLVNKLAESDKKLFKLKRMYDSLMTAYLDGGEL